MKNKFSILLTSFLLLIFFSCKKEENKIYYEGGTGPTLTASSTAVTLEPGQEANSVLTLKWIGADYEFTTGPSSHNVAYTIEFDTLGGDFSSSIKKLDNVGTDLSKTYTVAELNGILGNDMQLQLNPRRNYTIQARVVSSIPVSGGGSFFKLPSNVISFTTKPFAPPPKVQPPTTQTLWATGDAFASGWGNPLSAPYDVSQKFTKISNTRYELIVQMVGGGGYKLLQEWDWGTQYRMIEGGTWSGGDFKKENADPAFPGPPSAGNYKITVDFQLGKFTVVKL